WVREGRYRPVYVPGGVVTGRWASSGGGALQIPRQLRPALRADPGWRLVSADVSQLEPRVLAAMSGDRAMIAAGAGQDLYSGIVDAGIVATRQEAKIGVLGALYGGTTGDSGRVVPRLRRTFPDAMALVDGAAATGERGGTVTTWLGRSSPAVEDSWTDAQRSAHQPDPPAVQQEAARRSARDRGRFTRNFVVQGTAAEWALSWMAALRLRLARCTPVAESAAAAPSGPVFSRRAHLAFFLHDEVIVHAPAEQTEAAAAAIRDSAAAAGRLLFPGSPIDFPLDRVISARSAQKGACSGLALLGVLRIGCPLVDHRERERQGSRGQSHPHARRPDAATPQHVLHTPVESDAPGTDTCDQAAEGQGESGLLRRREPQTEEH